MEAQRLEAGTEVESTRSAVQEVGRKCDRGGKSEVRKVIYDSDSDESLSYIFEASKTLLRASAANEEAIPIPFREQEGQRLF